MLWPAVRAGTSSATPAATATAEARMTNTRPMPGLALIPIELDDEPPSSPRDALINGPAWFVGGCAVGGC